MDSTSALIAQAIGFLREIGLSIQKEDNVSGFSPGVEIRHGGLVVDPFNVQMADLLHEAGHLAIMPGQFRHLLNGNLMDGLEQALEAVSGFDPESPLVRAVLQCTDPEATAWAWAAGCHLELPSEQIIRDQDYAGSGESIRLALALRHYVGINGLDRAGLTAANERSAYITGLTVYPSLCRWLQPFDLASTTM